MIRTLGRLSALAFCVWCVTSASARADFEAPQSGANLSFDTSIAPVTGLVRLSFGYDDNLLFVPDAPPFHTGEKDATFAILDLSLATRLALGSNTTLQFQLDGSVTRNSGSQPAGVPAFVDDPSDYSMWSLTPRVALIHRSRWNGRPVTISPALSYRVEGGSEVAAVGSEGLQFRLDLKAAVSDAGTLSARVIAARTDFDVSFPGLPRRDRDGRYYEIGADYKHVLNRGRQAVRAGFALQRNDSEGSDWRFEGYKLSLGLDTHLVGRVFAKFDLSHAKRGYDDSFSDIVPGGRDEQTITELGARFLYVFNSRQAMELGVSHARYGSNNAAFEGDRTRAHVGYVFRF